MARLLEKIKEFYQLRSQQSFDIALPPKEMEQLKALKKEVVGAFEMLLFENARQEHAESYTLMLKFTELINKLMRDKHLSLEQISEVLDQDYLALVSQLRANLIIWNGKFPEYCDLTTQLLEVYFRSKQMTSNLSPKEMLVVVTSVRQYLVQQLQNAEQSPSSLHLNLQLLARLPLRHKRDEDEQEFQEALEGTLKKVLEEAKISEATKIFWKLSHAQNRNLISDAVAKTVVDKIDSCVKLVEPFLGHRLPASDEHAAEKVATIVELSRAIMFFPLNKDQVVYAEKVLGSMFKNKIGRKLQKFILANRVHLSNESREALLRDLKKSNFFIKVSGLRTHLVDHAFKNMDTLPSEQLILAMSVMEPQQREQMMHEWMSNPRLLQKTNPQFLTYIVKSEEGEISDLTSELIQRYVEGQETIFPSAEIVTFMGQNSTMKDHPKLWETIYEKTLQSKDKIREEADAKKLAQTSFEFNAYQVVVENICRAGQNDEEALTKVGNLMGELPPNAFSIESVLQLRNTILHFHPDKRNLLSQLEMRAVGLLDRYSKNRQDVQLRVVRTIHFQQTKMMVAKGLARLL